MRRLHALMPLVMGVGCARSASVLPPPRTSWAPSPTPSATSTDGATIRLAALSTPVDRYRYGIDVEGLPAHPPHAMPEVLALELPDGTVHDVGGVITALDGRGYHGLLEQLPPDGTWVLWGHEPDHMVRIGRIGRAGASGIH